MIKHLFILIAFPVVFFGLDLKGKTADADTKAPVQMTAVLLYSGTNLIGIQQTKDDGLFLFSNLNKGRYRLEAKAPGYYIEKIDIDLKGNMNKTVYLMVQSVYSLGEVTVIGEKEKGTQSKTTVTKSERKKAIASLTGDPVSVVTSMPGVEQTGGNAMGSPSKLSVRGGSGYENIALLDEALIPYPYHRLYSDSVFIDSLVGDITLYKGVLPARYGQAMSSLLDVKMNDASPGYFHGKVELGLLNVSAMLDGSSPDGKWSWMGGVRRMDYDLVLPLFMQINNSDAGRQIQIPYYLDSQGKIQYKDSSDLVSAIWHYSSEPSKSYMIMSNSNSVNNPDTIASEENFYNVLLSLRWKHIFSDTFSLDQTLEGLLSEDYQSFLHTNLTGNNSSFFTKTSEKELQYKIMAGVSLLQNDTVRFGGEIIYYPDLQYTNMSYRTVTNSAGQLETQTLTSSDYHGAYGIYAGFLENESVFFDNRLTVLAGLRYSYIDFVNKAALDPRLSVEYQIVPSDKIYTALGYLSQFPSDSSELSLLSTNRGSLDIPGCYHIVLGNQWQILHSLAFSVEGYYKDYNNQLTESSSQPVTYTTSGSDTHIYGAEVLLKKNPEDFPVYGWLGFSSYQVWKYSSVSTAQTGMGSTAASPANRWYQGDSLDYKLDMTAIWDIDRNWSLTGQFTWRSGSHYTPIKGSTKTTAGTNVVYEPVYGDYNSAKYEDSHSLNLKVERKAEIFSLPGGFYFQLNNIYNNKPVQGYTYNADYSQSTPQRSLLGIYPVFGAWLEW